MMRHLHTCFCVALAGLLAGCGPLLVRSSPATFPVPPDAAARLRGPQSVVLKNDYEKETPVKIFTGPRDWEADLKQYTESAMTLLGTEMKKKGVGVQPQASKSVTLRVRDVQAHPAAFQIRSSLILEARYGDGTSSVVTSYNNSPADAWRAVDGAIMRAVTGLLRDDQFVAYLNK